MMERAALGRPVFTVIGGPNGAGKSTYTDRLAVAGYDLGEVVNPDMIAAHLPGPDATRDNRAGRETLRRTRALIASGQTFSRETTLSGSEILRTDAGGEKRRVYGQPVLHRCGFGRHFKGSCQAAC